MSLKRVFCHKIADHFSTPSLSQQRGSKYARFALDYNYRQGISAQFSNILCRFNGEINYCFSCKICIHIK